MGTPKGFPPPSRPAALRHRATTVPPQCHHRATTVPRRAIKKGTIFALFFQTPFFTTICPKRAPTGTSEIGQKLKKLPKIWLPYVPPLETCKKASLGRAQTSKVTTLTHFELFFQMPRAAEMEPKWKPNWSLWAPKIQQKHEK